MGPGIFAGDRLHFVRFIIVSVVLRRAQLVLGSWVGWVALGILYPGVRGDWLADGVLSDFLSRFLAGLAGDTLCLFAS